MSLKYQTIAYGFLQDLYRDNQLEQVQTFKAMYDAQSLKHEQITSAETIVVSDLDDDEIVNTDSDTTTASGSSNALSIGWITIGLFLLGLITRAKYKTTWLISLINKNGPPVWGLFFL